MDKTTIAARAHDLAVLIYVELISRNTEVQQGSVKMPASATNLATLSIKLADAFMQAEAGAELAKEPHRDYKLDGADLAAWSK